MNEREIYKSFRIQLVNTILALLKAYGKPIAYNDRPWTIEFDQFMYLLDDSETWILTQIDPDGTLHYFDDDQDDEDEDTVFMREKMVGNQTIHLTHFLELQDEMDISIGRFWELPTLIELIDQLEAVVDPLRSMEEELNVALKNEDYETAATLRDNIASYKGMIEQEEKEAEEASKKLKKQKSPPKRKA